MFKLLLFRLLAIFERPPLSHLCAAAIRGTARTLRLDAALVSEFDTLLRDYPVHYAGAILVTLASLKLGLSAHVFNLNGFIAAPAARAAAARLVRSRLTGDDKLRSRRAQRLIREALLLENRTTDDAELLALARTELETFLAPARARPAKDGARFEHAAAGTALADADAVFRAMGVRMFLVSGTFLGAVRDGGFVRTEYDIDVGYFVEDGGQRAVYEAFRDAPAFVHANHSPLLIKAVHHSGITIDVFPHFAEDGLVWHGSNKHRWYNTPFTLAPYEFAGGQYLAPADAARYLEENYGNWRTPCAFWDVSFDTPNRVFPRTSSALFMLVNYVTQTGDRHRMQNALLALRDVFGLDYTDYIPSGGNAELRARLPGTARTLIVGCFDPPTREELGLIDACATEGNHVLVAAASDALLRAHGRTPVMTEAARQRLAAGLRGVDAVYLDDGVAARDAIRAAIGDVTAILAPGALEDAGTPAPGAIATHSAAG